MNIELIPQLLILDENIEIKDTYHRNLRSFFTSDFFPVLNVNDYLSIIQRIKSAIIDASLYNKQGFLLGSDVYDILLINEVIFIFFEYDDEYNIALNKTHFLEILDIVFEEKRAIERDSKRSSLLIRVGYLALGKKATDCYNDYAKNIYKYCLGNFPQNI